MGYGSEPNRLLPAAALAFLLLILTTQITSCLLRFLSNPPFPLKFSLTSHVITFLALASKDNLFY